MKLVVGFLLLWLLFGAIEYLFPLQKAQKRFRRGWIADTMHFFINHVLINVGTFCVAIILYILLHGLINPSLQLVVRSQPSWLQFGEAFLLAQLIFYILHRLAHTIPWLWRFHAIHHSSSQLDWLASARLHPVESILVNTGIGIPLFFLGFTRETFGFYLTFATFLAIFNHSNTCLRFPILRHIIATPEFHHWHHSNDLEARNKNFSGFPILDRLFGTYYSPNHKMPTTYGVDQIIPSTYWSQLLYPFENRQNLNKL